MVNVVLLVKRPIPHFFLFGEAAFLPLAGMALAVLGLGALGFLVGPALLDFLALEGDLGLGAALGLAAAFFSTAATGFLAFAGEAAAAFFCAAAFFAFGVTGFLAVFAEALSEEEAAARLTGDFFALETADEAGFLLSATEMTLAPPEVVEASLNEPDAPLPFVWTRDPDATALFRYFLMKGATFSASTL
jgi:hypothetical protein